MVLTMPDDVPILQLWGREDDDEREMREPAMTTTTLKANDKVTFEGNAGTVYRVVYTMADGKLVHIQKTNKDGKDDRRSVPFTAKLDRLAQIA